MRDDTHQTRFWLQFISANFRWPYQCQGFMKALEAISNTMVYNGFIRLFPYFTSFLYLIRCGWSSPRRLRLFSSYSLNVPSNQNTCESPSNARIWYRHDRGTSDRGDNYGTTAKISRGFFQCPQGVHIKVVGGFIEQQQIAALFRAMARVCPIAHPPIVPLPSSAGRCR